MPDLKRHVNAIHFVGIGGVGMSGIAEVLLNQGLTVSGSDRNFSHSVRHLQALGAKVVLGHAAEHCQQADVVVISSAIASDNVEVVAAKAARIPVISRAEMLAELMRFRHGIAVAGTHGKTTTTSLIASLLAEEGLDPTFVIGGRLNSAGTNARLGSGRYFVAEADESDASFLLLKPMTAVVTNIERDHMNTYQGDFDKLKQTFLSFLHHLPFYGLAVMCLDDPVIAELLADVHRPICTYGFDEKADVRAVDYRTNGLVSEFTVLTADWAPLKLTLNLPGQHNVSNALAAIGVARESGVSEANITAALEQFAGIDRRFQVTEKLSFCEKNITVVDDYGHHPSEVAATIKTLREVWPERRLLLIFQPHRYSRTRDLFDDFAAVLSGVDVLLLLEVYAAGEAHIAAADSRALARAVRQRGRLEPIYLEEQEQLRQTLEPVVQEGDVLLFSGAGSIGQMVQQVLL